MKTLDPIDAVLDKLTIESAKELGNGYVVYARGMAYVIDAVRAALSSLPAQAGAEGLREAAEWHKRAALILSSDNPLKAWHTACVAAMNILAEEAALAPSQPAAVAVTDEMVGRAIDAWHADKQRTFASTPKSSMRAALEAALRSTP